MISIAEARRLQAEAELQKKKGSILSQWYSVLAMTLEEQERHGLSEPDFSSHWIINHSEAEIQEVIGSQLEELGLKLQYYPVSNGFESAERIYIIRPGQEPRLNVW